MAETELGAEEVWEGDQAIVLAPPHLREEGLQLQEDLRDRPEASGAVVFATSGTTGDPKWILHTRATLLASARMVNRHLAVTPDDRWLLALPEYHVGGFGIVARAREAGVPWTRLAGKWDPASFAESLRAGSTTLTSLVPTQVHDLVAAGLRAPDSLRVILVGGGRLPESLGQRARDLGWPVLPTYGLTEAASQVATASVEALAGDYTPGPLQVLDGWEVRTGPDGLLEIRGEALFRALVTRRDSGLAIIPVARDEFWTTNDLARLSDDSLTVLGRKDRVVKTRGELVDLDSLEDRLNDPENKVGVFHLLALPDARIEHRLVPVAVSGQPDEAARRVELVNASLPKFARLEAPVVLDSVPKTPLGKVNYKGLAALLEKSRR